MPRKPCWACHGNGYVRNLRDNSVGDCNTCHNQGELDAKEFVETRKSQRKLGE
jgi:DnaJ-class molecular chaperone